MSKCAEWVEDMLGVVKEFENPDAVCMIEDCGKKCAERKSAVSHMAQLKAAAADCKTRSDYVEFLNQHMPVHIEEAEDGIVMHLGKTECSCPMAKELSHNTEMLCECTRGHEKAVWSAFFGKPVEVKIVESILRGGNDCVTKIKI